MFDFDPYTLFFSILFSIVGIGYYSYGKKESLYFQITGAALLIYPYFVSHLSWLIGVGIVLMALPFVLNWIRQI